MSDLIPKNTDEEMERYMEADMIRRARIPMEGNAGSQVRTRSRDQARERAVPSVVWRLRQDRRSGCDARAGG
jgi:hypothetical protein